MNEKILKNQMAQNKIKQLNTNLMNQTTGSSYTNIILILYQESGKHAEVFQIYIKCMDDGK